MIWSHAVRIGKWARPAGAPESRSARARRRRGGTSMIETAIALPVVMLVLLGTLEFGLIFSRYQVLVGAAREAGRIASLARTDCRAGAVKGEIDRYVMTNANQLGMLVLPTNVTVSNLCSAQGTPINLRLSYDHYMLLLGGMLPGDTRVPLTVTSQVIKE